MRHKPLINQKLLSQIQNNHPELEPQYAEKIAFTIEKVSKKYRVDPRRVAAIAMQESAYELGAKHCYKIAGKIRCDFCMMQINDRTAERYGFKKAELMTNMNYCVEAGVKVLTDFRIQYGKRDKNFWTRYNTSDPDLREIYKKLVNRWM